MPPFVVALDQSKGLVARYSGQWRYHEKSKALRQNNVFNIQSWVAGKLVGMCQWYKNENKYFLSWTPLIFRFLVAKKRDSEVWSVWFSQYFFFQAFLVPTLEALKKLRGSNTSNLVSLCSSNALLSGAWCIYSCKIRVKTNQWAIFKSHVHLCKPQYKSTGVDELSISCINFWYSLLQS